MKNKKWMRWALANALVKTFTVTIQKVIGLSSQTFGQVSFVALIVSLLQVSAGLLVIAYKKTPLMPNRKGLVSSLLFGFGVFWVTVLSFRVFQIGGDMFVNTFIISLGIILGALADIFFFGERLTRRQWFGIFLAACAGYIVLGLPSLASIIALPPWIFLSFLIMIVQASNSVLNRYAKDDLTGSQKNFWGGLSMLATAMLFIPFWDKLGFSFEFSIHITDLMILGILSGIGAVLIWNLGLLSYRDGAYIALESLIVSGVLLSFVALSGRFIFGEGDMLIKFIGVSVYLVAFSFVHKETGNFFASIAKKMFRA